MAGGGQLRVDYDDLSELDARLTNIMSTLQRESGSLDTLAGAVGDSRLAGSVRDFGSGWVVNRVQILENLGWLRDSVKHIHTDLAATDAELANGLTESPSASATRGPQAV